MERKLATVLFVDLVDSTRLLSATDPEVFRRRVTRFFDGVAHCVEAYGGIVEKYAGDAVLAAFGVRQAHEDDAERAVRAALAVLDRVRELGLEARVGIEAGQVVVEDGDTNFATGEPINVAARLQQGAAPGEIVIGPGAHRLTFGRLDVEDLGQLELKGLEPMQAWRVLAARDGARPLGSLGAPLIGRDAELELLENTFARTVRDRRAQLFTIYGEPGVGKSRLGREFVEGVEGATVLVGRSLPYGEGITYWPLAEMVKCAAGISDDDPLEEAFEKLRACCEEEAVADLLGVASGVLEALEEQRSQQEISWAAREWAEKLAETQPVILAFEDIHWAEEPLLELIEHLAAWVRAPLLLLCLARPELLDLRPGWGGGRVRATAIELEPLGEAESEELLEALLVDEAGLRPEARRRLLEKTEGNPLFVEETIRTLLEQGSAAVEGIPDTLQALIGARIDRLPPAEKALLQRAALVGRIFWDGALAYLSPELEDIEAALEGLVLSEFFLAEPRSTISGESAFRFKHVLFREVAYGGLSKAARAEHHARFADWLKERAGDELLEIRAYHLDHAVTLLAELDGAAPADLVGEAAKALSVAAKRALGREANRSARKLALRAVELEPTLERRYRAAEAARRLNDLPAVAAEMERVRAAAFESGDAELEGRALTALVEVTLLKDADVPKARELAERALDVLENAHPAARLDALHQRFQISWWLGDLGEAERYATDSLTLAREAGLKHHESVAAHQLAGIYRVRLELERVEPLLDRALELADESGSIVARASALGAQANFHYVKAEYDEAERIGEEVRTLLSEAGAAWRLARHLMFLAHVARRKGDPERAERLLREAMRILKPLEDRGALCEVQRFLAELLVAKGKLDEAERLALQARETVGAQDVISVATTTMTLGLVRGAQGRDEEAEELLRSAVAALAETDFREMELDVLESLVQFLRERGRDEDAAPFVRRLIELAPAAGIAAAFPNNSVRTA